MDKLDKEKPLVSVLIECYNYENFISEAIESVLNQTYENFELIIVDDCSSDSSYKKIQQFKDPRIKAFRNEENKGFVKTRNESLGRVNGEFVAFLDADDVWEPNKLEVQVSYLLGNNEYLGSFTNASFIDEYDKEYTDSKDLDSPIDLFKFEYESRGQIANKFYKQGNFLAHTSAVIRTKAIMEVGLFDVSLSHLQDFEYWTRLLLCGDVYVHKDILLKVRRKRENRDNMSALNDSSVGRLINESSYIIYKFIVNMDLELFCNAFKNECKIKPTNATELICEKYFLLLNWYCQTINNKLPAVLYIFNFLNDPKVLDTLSNKYNYSISDIYYETGSFINLYPNCTSTRINELSTLCELKEQYIKDLKNSTSWKITSPLRMFLKIIRNE